MFANLPSASFRFLDLPGEIRNHIYDLLLCSWEDETEQDTSLISQLSRRKPSYQATSLFCANKQIHAEASDYMVKRNQFVRITCRGVDVRKLFLAADIPVITTSANKVGQFSGYVMHMTLFKPAYVQTTFRFPEYDVLTLRSDLPKLCEQLDIESVMVDANSSTSAHTSLHAEIRLNYAYARFYSHKIQEHLLEPIATLRGLPNLKVQGPVDHAVAQTVKNKVARPRWHDPQATLEEIETGVDVGKRQWQQNNYYAAAESWAYAMRTLERMRHSSSWLGLQKVGGEDFVNKTADLYFTLHLFHAQFLHIDMANEQVNRHLVHRNGNIAHQHLRKCETASARFAQHAGATWSPSNTQMAKMLFRQASCIRLMQDTANRLKSVTLVEQAAALAPTDLAIRDEKDAILSWNTAHEEMQHILEESSGLEAQSPSPQTVWSSIWTAVVELAASKHIFGAWF
ncbi:hypothetical protein ACN47E_003495 [Coniothyrium glycines]